MLLTGKGLQAAILLGVAFAFGGGGSGVGLANLVVQLVALALIAFNLRAVLDFFSRAPRFLAILVGATLLLPLLQSIPLPPSIWQILPGRTMAQESLHLLGKDDSWAPMSLEVRRTLLAFLSLIPGLTILVLTWSLPDIHKNRLLFLIAAAGVCVVLLGAQQLVTGNRTWVFFDEGLGSSDLQGTFANRNSAGLFLDIALCALVAVYPKGQGDLRWKLASVIAAILLLVGLVLTRSRSSMALVIVPAAFCIFTAWRSRISARISRRTLVATILGLAVLTGGVVLLASENQRIQHSLSRFDNFEDRRPLIWADTWGSIKRFWPLGSGIGTFDEVFQLDETLENVQRARAARAHEDYLEMSLESGVVGIALLLAWAVALIVSGRRAIRTNGPACAAAAVFALLAFQSFSDYPLRNQTLLCVAGLMLALLVNAPFGAEKGRERRKSGYDRVD